MTSEIQRFTNYCRELGQAHPELQDCLQDTYELTLSEIEDNGMESHELSLAYAYIEDELLCG